MSEMMLRALVLYVLSVAAAAAPVASQALPGCPSKCGEIDVPYPFGIDDGCHKSEGNFNLRCDNSDPSTPPVLIAMGLHVKEIDLLQGRMCNLVHTRYECYNEDGIKEKVGGWKQVGLLGSPFSFSADRNRFVVSGCDTEAYLSDRYGFGFSTGCVSLCSNLMKLQNYSCSGLGCCQTDIPLGLKYFEVEFDTFNTHTCVWSFNPCSYAFLVEENGFNFTTEFLAYYTKEKIDFPVVLDWSIEGETNCEAAKENKTFYACRSRNSECVPSNNGLGYLCKCSGGYTGNPYLNDGCIDVDECVESNRYPCHGDCTNTIGDYNCTCKPGHHSDNAKTKECTEDPTAKGEPVSLKLGLALAIGLGGGFLVLFVGASSFIIRKRSRKRQKKNLRDRHFYQNHGLLLQQLIASHDNATERTKIFTLKELEKATNNFDPTRIVGHGGHGMVYKGLLSDQRVVAIKKSKIKVQVEIEQFINEVAILSRVEHKNVVRILGCCLESEVPLLVYEFVSNGTLSDHLHVWNRDSYMSWGDRLRIAAEVASAVAYLHFDTSKAIFHRDLKSANILLDEKSTAKVSDFGASKSLLSDQTHITTAVQGTFGYLDPEYFHTGRLTDKSDVYSFGVILVELLTGEKPVSQTQYGEDKNLITHFIWLLTESSFFQVLEAQIVNEAEREELA